MRWLVVVVVVVVVVVLLLPLTVLLLAVQRLGLTRHSRCSWTPGCEEDASNSSANGYAHDAIGARESG